MNFIKKIITIKFFLVCLIYLFTKVAIANDIPIGMTAALSGLSKDLGQQMKSGIELGFAEVNSSGGIKGKKLKLISLDDGYKPLLAASNMRTLIEEEKVLAIIGNTGTPTAVLTAPIANKNKVLMFGSYTGADFLRNNDSGCCIYNYRASYEQETAMMVEHILNSGIDPNEIAFFAQNDAYGDAGYNGAIKAIKSSGYNASEQLLDTRYRRNTINVEQSVADVLMLVNKPKAIIMIGSYEASSAFIKLLKPELPNIKFYNISFTGSIPLLKSLGEYSEGVYITEVVPNVSSSVQLSKDYRNALKNFKQLASNANPISFEGYIIARIFINALKSIEGTINKTTVLDAIKNLEYSVQWLGGKNNCKNTSPKQVSQTVWLNKVVEGKFKNVSIKYCED